MGMRRKEFSSSNYRYKPDYLKPGLRGELEEPRPWDITEIINGLLPSNGVLLDVGTGGAGKIMPLAQETRLLLGLDLVSGLLLNAKMTAAEKNIHNLTLFQGDARHLPFANGIADVVSFILSPHHASEAFRVLKSRPSLKSARGGTVVIERVGQSDKAQLKKYFGVDEKGPRGQHSDRQPGALEAEYRDSLVSAGFEDIAVRRGNWKTWYTLEGLLTLLKNTPAVRGFDQEKDAQILENIVRELSTPNGIEVTQSRILLIGRKP